LEQNEDIIAAVVENMQLGRMEDCIQHFSILHKNIISLALALDNFPAGEHSRLPYHDIYKFPDEIMRKDILDERRPLGETKLPQAPLIPACVECNNKKFTAHKCRIELGHIEPSSAFSSLEVQEFLKVAQLIEFRGKTEEEPVKAKRVYRMWTPFERFTVFLGVSKYGMKGANLQKILNMLPGRNEGQLRSYISKNISDDEIAAALHGVIPPVPDQYVYPADYTHDVIIQQQSSGSNSNSGTDSTNTGDGFNNNSEDGTGTRGASSSGSSSSSSVGMIGEQSQFQQQQRGHSRLEPRHGTMDWMALLGA
jgi:hypothetical protein